MENSSSKPWANYPAVNFSYFSFKILYAISDHLFYLLRRYFLEIVLKYGMNNELWRIAFYWSCCQFGAKNMCQICSHFKRSHSRIERSTGILKTASNNSNDPIFALNGLVRQLGKYFCQLLEPNHNYYIYTKMQVIKFIQQIDLAFKHYKVVIEQYQCQLMKKNNEKELLLPVITAYKTPQRPIKDILKDLKQKKHIIQQRIKTQIDEPDPDNRQQTQSQLRDRIITEVPYYINRNTYYKRVNGVDSMHQLENLAKNTEYSEDDQEQFQPLKSQKLKRNSILQPIPDKQEQPSINYKQQVQQIENGPRTQKQITKKLQQILIDVPVDPRERTQQNIQQLKLYLVQNNMLFAKIHNMIAICLLKLNRIVWIERHQTLYKIGQERHVMYIILSGRLKLYNSQKGFKKICSGGQTVGQELIFSNKIKKVVLESAKAISKCFLIEIKSQNYRKMSEQMVRYGYKLVFNQMESIIKRNYITKNWLRSQKSRYEKRH